MSFYCDLCHKEMPEDCSGWESFTFGVVCEEHNHGDIAKVVELTSIKVREALIAEMTDKFRTQAINILEGEGK